MDRSGVMAVGAKWYRRLQVQLWLWAILPLTLVLVGLTFSGVYGHQMAMRDFVVERDLGMAQLYGRQIEDALAHGLVRLDGSGLPLVMGDARVGQHGVVYVLDAQGRVLFHPDPTQLGLDLGENPAVRHALASGAGAASGRLGDGSPSLASFVTVGETGWRVLVEEPVDDVIVPILQFSSVLPILVAIAGLLSLVTIFFSLRTIVWPLQSLAEEAAQVTGGGFSGLQRDVGGVEEIRQLQRTLRDMVERIRHYQESMRDYIDGITRGQEAERSRLSRELHDETVQGLVAVGQRLQLAQRALERGQTQVAVEGMGKTRELCQEMLSQLRRTIRALRPVYLEDLGFLPALETLVREARDLGLSAEILIHGEPRRLRPEVELAAFRVAQEALSNTIRHACAQQVTLLVCFGEHELSLAVEDDGVGFALPDTPDTLTQAGHFGLVGMRERALLLGGRLDVGSQPGQGTRVTAHFPV